MVSITYESQIPFFQDLSAVSALTFRGWILLEYHTVVLVVLKRLTLLKTCMMLSFLAFISSVMSLKAELRLDRYLVSPLRYIWHQD